MDVIPLPGESKRIVDPYFGKSFLPNWRSHSVLPAGTKSEPALDKLHCAFDSDLASDCDQQVKMIRHDDKFVQPVLALRPVFVKGPHKEFGGTSRLEDPVTSPRCGSDKERLLSCNHVERVRVTYRNRHRSPAAKAGFLLVQSAAWLKPCPDTKLWPDTKPWPNTTPCPDTKLSSTGARISL